MMSTPTNAPAPTDNATLKFSQPTTNTTQQANQPETAREFVLATESNSESFADSSSGLFSLYLSHAEKHDKDMMESWQASADGILVFTGLFAAALASFVIDSYKSLLPDSAGDTVKILAQISQQLDGLSNGTRASIESFIPPQSGFQPPTSAVVVNALWFLSLVISLFCALLATLQQRWARQYLYVAHPHVATHKRARIRSYFAAGVARFYAAVTVEAIPGLLHVSVFLFLAGLVISALNIHHTVAYVVLAATGVCALVYLMITVLPAVYHDFPYTSPFSALIWIISQKIAIGFRYTIDHVAAFRKRRLESAKASPVKMREFKNMIETAHDAAENSGFEIDARALGWTLDKLDEPRELMQFAAGIRGFSSSCKVKNPISILQDAAKQSTLHKDLYQRIFLLLMRASDIKLLRDSQLLSKSEAPRCRQICLEALYFLPDAIKKLLAHIAFDTFARPDKVEARFKPILHSAEAWKMAEILSQRDNRVREDVTIGAQCVAAVQATQEPNEETRPILMRQLNLKVDVLESYLDPFENLLLKNLNDFLENTALKFIEQQPGKKPKKGGKPEGLTEPKELKDKDMILSTLLLLGRNIKDFQKIDRQLRSDYVEKWNKINVCAGQALGTRSENAKKLLGHLHIQPGSPSTPPNCPSVTTPPVQTTDNNPSTLRSRDSYIEMSPMSP